MLKYLKENSLRALLLHLTIILTISLIVLFGFFYYYLPAITKQGESITVPDLTGLQIDQVAEKLEELGLEYVIFDSSAANFSTEYIAGAVLSHSPPKEAKVKLNRKIYLTINPSSPPLVALPNLIDTSLKNARTILASLGLVLGEVTFIEAPYPGSIEMLRYKGQELTQENLAGQKFEVPKGSIIDLVVRNGLEAEISVPDLVGKPLDEAQESLYGYNLLLGEVHYEKSEKPIGTVLSQEPKAGQDAKIKVGRKIDLWVSGYEPDESILNQLPETQN